jgi:hypothetical protein
LSSHQPVTWTSVTGVSLARSFPHQPRISAAGPIQISNDRLEFWPQHPQQVPVLITFSIHLSAGKSLTSHRLSQYLCTAGAALQVHGSTSKIRSALGNQFSEHEARILHPRLAGNQYICPKIYQFHLPLALQSKLQGLILSQVSKKSEIEMHE